MNPFLYIIFPATFAGFSLIHHYVIMFFCVFGFWVFSKSTEYIFDIEPVTVYVTGIDSTGINHSVAKYWKNGIPILLTEGSGNESTTALTISGNDIYVTGNGIDPITRNSVAKYWKNGRPVKLTNGTSNAFTFSIAVSGNDVYVAGIESGTNGNFIAKYWKNGNAVALTDESTNSFANAIAVSQNDIYVAGSEGSIAKYWKNGHAVDLSEGTLHETASGIFISTI